MAMTMSSWVLILIVVDDGLVPNSAAATSSTTAWVLILIVVDDGLVLTIDGLDGERVVKS